MTQADSPGNLEALRRHGGRLDAARRAFPAAPEPWLDLSTGINPNPWRPEESVPFDPAPLPTAAALRALEAAAARHFGADPASVAAVPGSEVALRLLPHLGLPGPIAARPPTYGTHVEVARGEVVAGGGPARAGTLLLANPNNPDGRYLSPAALGDLAERQAAAGGWLVVDEAFADAVQDGAPARLDAAARVVVLRSFGKFFGLAGLRLGFVVAPEPVVARVRALTGDWPVGAQALAWGRAAYADRRWIERTRRSLRADAARLDALLAEHGLPARGACPLFRLVEHRHASAVFDRLARAGVLTRPFAERTDWLRLGLPGDAAGFERLGRALGSG